MDGTEIPQCSSLLHRRVCYASEARETLDSETPPAVVAGGIDSVQFWGLS